MAGSRYDHFDRGDFFINPNDLIKFRSIFFDEGIAYFYEFRKNLIFYAKKLDDLTRRIEKLDHKKLSDRELRDYINKYFKIALEANCFLLPFPLSDKMLTDKILNLLPAADNKGLSPNALLVINFQILRHNYFNNFCGLALAKPKKFLNNLTKIWEFRANTAFGDSPNNQKQEWLKIFAFPIEENEHTKEAKSFFKLIKSAIRTSGNYKTNQLFIQEMDKHLKKYGWIGGRYFWEEAWTKEDLIKRIEEFLEEKKDIIAETKHLRKIRQENNSNFSKLIKKLNIKKSSELYKYILLARDFSYLRTWRTDNIYHSFYRTKNLFRELAARVGLGKQDDIRYLGFEEIIKTSEDKKLSISASEISARKNFYVCAIFNGKTVILSGGQWKKNLSFLFQKNDDKEIKGTVAFKGKIKGTVKIVMQNSDLEKVKKGDIMAATMTFPHFIPAMEKAAAFITDEGGILCHAAIVAREMRKPCVIGTGNATKILKDGDLVEVDAERGIVSRLAKDIEKLRN